MDGVENSRELFVEVVLLVKMRMPQLIYVLGEVSKEEDVVFADFTSNFDLQNVSRGSIERGYKDLRWHHHTFQ